MESREINWKKIFLLRRSSFWGKRKDLLHWCWQKIWNWTIKRNQSLRWNYFEKFWRGIAFDSRRNLRCEKRFFWCKMKSRLFIWSKENSQESRGTGGRKYHIQIQIQSLKREWSNQWWKWWYYLKNPANET